MPLTPLEAIARGCRSRYRDVTLNYCNYSPTRGRLNHEKAGLGDFPLNSNRQRPPVHQPGSKRRTQVIFSFLQKLFHGKNGIIGGRHTHRVESVWCNRMSIFGSIRCPKLTTLGLQGARVSRYVIVISQPGYFNEDLKVQNYEKNISLVYFDDQTRGCRPPALSPCVKR